MVSLIREPIGLLRAVRVKLMLRDRVLIDFETRIRSGVKVSAGKRSRVDLRSATLDRFAAVHASESSMIELRSVFVGQGAIVGAIDSVTIGPGSMLGEYTSVRDHNHVSNRDVRLSEWKFNAAPVDIGREVWIAAKATILCGVVIGESSIIGANTVVTKNVDPEMTVVGIAGRAIFDP